MFTELVNEPAAGKVTFKVKSKSQKGSTDAGRRTQDAGRRTHALSVYPSGAPLEYAKVSLSRVEGVCFSATVNATLHTGEKVT